MATKKTAPTTTPKTSKTAAKKAAATATPATPSTPVPAPPAPDSPVLLQPSAPITGVANGSNKGTKIDLQTSYQAFITGLQTYYQPTDTFALKTGTLTRDEVIAEAQKFIAAAENTKASNRVWRADAQTERAVELEVAPIRRGVRNVVEGRFDENGIELLSFGFEPRKPPVKTVASKMEGIAKAKATRTARGTKGSEQKKDIHGTVPATPAAPDAPPSSPAPVASTTTKS
jgi:hypothetical protein